MLKWNIILAVYTKNQKNYIFELLKKALRNENEQKQQKKTFSAIYDEFFGF